VADLQVSIALLLENQEEVARELERAGGIAGKDFGSGLSEGAKKALDDLIAQATAAAKKVGLVFNSQKFQFETAKGDIVPPNVIKSIGEVSKEFNVAQKAVQAFKAALSAPSKIDDRSIAGLSKKLADLQSKQTIVNIDSKEFIELQREIDTVNKELGKVQSRRILIDANAESVLSIVTALQDKLDQLKQARLRVNVNSEEFTNLGKQITETEKNISDIENKQVIVDFDEKSLQGLQTRLNELQSRQTKVSVNSSEFIQLQKDIDKVKTQIADASKNLLAINVDPKSIQALGIKLNELQAKQAKINVDSSDFTKLQKEIDSIKDEITEANKRLLTLNVDPKSIQALSARLNELRTKQTKVSVDSTEFKKLEVEITKIQKEIEDIGQKKILLNVDTNSIAALTARLEARIRDLRQRRLTIPIDTSEFKKLGQEINRAERELNELRKKVGDFDEFNILESAITGAALSLTNNITDGLLIALGSVRNLVGGFLELDSEIRLAAAAAGEQGGYQKLGTVIEQVGIEAAGTSKQVAELSTSLVRAGFSIDEVTKALPGVVRGAEATGTAYQQFGEIVGNTLRGFGLDVQETSRVVDVLTNAANSSNASIEGLGYTFQYAAPIAKSLGVNLEDLAAATGLMANAGIQGSVAGTGLRFALAKLQQAAGGASPEVMGLAWNQTRLASAMEKIGATVIDAQGKLLPLEQVFLRLKEGLDDLSQADQVQLTNILFGDEAGSKMLAILNQNSQAIVKMFGDMKNSAGATDVARKAMSGARLEILQLQGTVDALGNKLGEVTVIGMRPLVGTANMLVGAIAGMPGPVKTTVAALVVLAGAAAAATVGLGALNLVVGQTGGWALLASNAKMAAASVASIGGTATLVIGAAAALAVFTGAIKETDEASRSLLQTMTSLAAAVATFRTLSTFKVPPILTAILSLSAGIAAYAGIGSQIKITSDEVRKLSEETKGLEDEITSLQSQVEEGKELGLDTKIAEDRIEKLSVKLQSLKGPLEIKLDLQKAESQVEELRSKLKANWQLGGPAAFGGRPSNTVKDQSIPIVFPLILPSMLMKQSSIVQGISSAVPSFYGTKTGEAGESLQLAQIEAAERIRDIYKEIERGKIENIVGEAAKRDATEIQKLSNKVNELKLAATKLPITAKTDRTAIDKELGVIQQRIEGLKARIKVDVNSEEVLLAQAAIERQLENTNLTAQQRNELEKDLLILTNERLKLQKEQISNADRINKVAESEKDKSITQLEFYKKLVEGTKAAATEQLAAGKITKSQAEENIRLVQLQQLEAEKLAKLNEIAAREAKRESTTSLRAQLTEIEEKKIPLIEQSRQASLEKELSLIQVQKAEYLAIVSNRLAEKEITTQQYENELRYIDRVAIEREKVSKQRQLALVDPESQEGLGLRAQIASLDKSLAENRLATAKAVSEQIASEVESYSTMVDLASKRLDIENQSREQSKNGYDIEMQLVQAITEQIRARQELIRSEFAVSGAFINRDIADAQAVLSSLQSGLEKTNGKDDRVGISNQIARQEAYIASLKNRASKEAIRAKEIELAGLQEQERIEMVSLDLKQRMAIIDQESRSAQSRFLNYQAAIELKRTLAKSKDPNLAAQERKELMDMAKIQEEALNLSSMDVKFQNEKLKTLQQINRIERDNLLMNQQSRRNNVFSELVNLGGARFAGGDVTPNKDWIINEIGRESFLSDSGQLSWINRPANSLWRPPSKGMVIPANVSEYLASAGLLPGGSGRGSAGTGGRLDRIAYSIGMSGDITDRMMRQTLAMGKLQKSIDKLASKDWSITVPIPSNARLLRTTGGF
jgi:TP901 family phage tail tape measure protein